MVLALLALTPSGVVGETLQHNAATEMDEEIYDLVRNIGAFSKVETMNESIRFDYLCGADTTNTLGDNCMANDVHMILYRTSLQNTKFDLREITVKNLGTPDDVDLEIYVCYPIRKTDTYPNQMECQRQWQSENDRYWEGGTTMKFLTNSHRGNELFVYVRAWDNNENDGDRTRISIEIEILDDARANDDHNEPRPLTIGTTYNDEVCQTDCNTPADQDRQDAYTFSFFKGDSFDIEFWSTECEGTGGNVNNQITAYVSLWRASSPQQSSEYSWSISERGCDRTDNFQNIEIADADEPGWLIVRLIASNGHADYDSASYAIELSMHDTSQRDTNHDTDGDGWTDVKELDCATNFLLSSDVPLDTDGDWLCDDVDPDDDNDGVNDESDDCPTSYNAPGEANLDDHDGDGCTNQDDDDDDNDGVVDNTDQCPFGSPNIISTPNNDVDEDGCLNEEDLDDDNDGWDDTVETSCNTNPLDAGSTPVDTDGDGQCDHLDSDDDNDGVNDGQDRFPKDEDEWQDRDADGIGDNADLDDDNDGVEDDRDHYPYDPTQVSDRDGDGCGDNPYGNGGDRFPDDPSQCLDSDEDGYGDNPDGYAPDQFPSDSSQWRDSDGDGYGDNENGNNPDLFPDDPTQWRDKDGDGYGDNPNGNNPDAFPDDESQWSDADGDRYGDTAWGTNADACPNDYGTSFIDRYGCPDDDTDGRSNVNDDCPDVSGDSQFDRKGCTDTDDDGYSNPSTSWLSHPNGLADAFPFEPTQWRDADRDGFGDNQNGEQPDACPGVEGTSSVDRWGCPDGDNDGWSDLTDAFPEDPTQWSDEDRDGYGDNPPPAKNPDDCPTEPGNSTIPGRIGCPPLPDKDNDGVPDEDDLCDKQGMNQIQQQENTCWQAIFAGNADWKTQGAMVLGFIPLIFTLALAPILLRRQQ